MVPGLLPLNPDLRRLRDLARALQRACRSGDPAAQNRLLAVFPDADAAQALLSKALAVVAREYGYPSWPRLKADVEARRTPKSGDQTRRNAKPIYEGKAKILYESAEPGALIQYFKDDTTAFDAAKKAVLEGKGVINNRISEHIMTRLNAIGVQNHFIRRLNLREQLIREVEIIPLEVVCRNVAAGSLSQRFGLPEGQPLPRPIVEFYLKDDKLHDPMVSEEHITAFNWASTQEIDHIMALTLRVNDHLRDMFGAVGVTLVDFKIEFGRIREGEVSRLILADEISPDSCRLWDTATHEKLDKDRFRRDLGDVVESYAEVARRLGVINETPSIPTGVY
jgi:phosphoribosylaminoimidazole-succinocarboxamide synthase